MYPVGTLVRFKGGRFEKPCFGVVYSIEKGEAEYIVRVIWPIVDSSGDNDSEFYFDLDGSSDYDNSSIVFLGEKNV